MTDLSREFPTIAQRRNEQEHEQGIGERKKMEEGTGLGVEEGAI